jgi:hypothetical protein
MSNSIICEIRHWFYNIRDSSEQLVSISKFATVIFNLCKIYKPLTVKLSLQFNNKLHIFHINGFSAHLYESLNIHNKDTSRRVRCDTFYTRIALSYHRDIHFEWPVFYTQVHAQADCGMYNSIYVKLSWV